MAAQGRPKLDRELDARSLPELVGVHAQAEPGPAPRLEHRARLVGVERALLAEHVDPAGRGGAGLEHRPAHERDVVVGALGVFRGDDVGAEQRDVAGQLGGQPAQPLLAVDVERIARFDFERRDARSERLRSARRGERAELLGGGSAGGVDRRHDPARLVRSSRHPGGKLGAALAREDEVGVAVDEAGDHAAPSGVDPLVRGGPRRLDRRHPSVLDHEGHAVTRPQGRLAESRFVGHEQPDVVDDQARHTEVTRAVASASSRGTSSETWRPSRTTCRPATITSPTSAAPAAKTTASSRSPGSDPARRTLSSETQTRSASEPAAILPPSGQPRLA